MQPATVKPCASHLCNRAISTAAMCEGQCKQEALQLELNQYKNFDGEIITLENDFDFHPINALEESETEEGEPCYRFAIDEDDSIWLDGDGNEVTEYLSA